MESERPDALFTDPFARRLAGEHGEEIVASIKRGRAAAWPMIVRTKVFDEMLTACLAGGTVDCAVNLAAGLDARPWRMALPASLRWIDVDLPDILQYKLDALAGERPHCAYEAQKVNLTDVTARGALMEHIGRESRNCVVLTEGLLIYLTAEDVGALARDLHSVTSVRTWIIDLASPRLLKMMSRTWGKAAAKGNAPFQFAPADGTAFFRPFGWRESEFRSSMDEARRLGREMRFAPVWRFVGSLYPARIRESFRRMSGIVRLDRMD